MASPAPGNSAPLRMRNAAVLVAPILSTRRRLETRRGGRSGQTFGGQPGAAARRARPSRAGTQRGTGARRDRKGEATLQRISRETEIRASKPDSERATDQLAREATSPLTRSRPNEKPKNRPTRHPAPCRLRTTAGTEAVQASGDEPARWRCRTVVMVVSSVNVINEE